MPAQKIRIVCVSDTHNASPGEGYTLPKGDMLIHAGDWTNQGSAKELQKAMSWLRQADFEVKVVVAGNHELSLDERCAEKDDDALAIRRLVRESDDIFYLEHEDATIDVKGVNLRVFGSPCSLAASERQWAFQYPEDQAERVWSAIPGDTDIVITHTPPAGHQDLSKHWVGGCSALLRKLSRTKPLLHICGHCHEGRGGQVVHWSDKREAEHSLRQWQDPGAGNKKQSLFDLTSSRGGFGLQSGKETAIVNASIMARSHRHGNKAFNKPIVVDLELPTGNKDTEAP